MTDPPKFTAEALLSAPRRGPASPNSRGSKALYTVSTYSFERHSKTVQTRLMDIESGDSELFSEDSSCYDAYWIGDDDGIVYFQSAEKGRTKLVASHKGSSSVITELPGAVSNLKVAAMGGSKYVIAMVAKATPDGQMYNPETAEKPLSSAMAYTSMFVRYWDEWIMKEVNQIFYLIISEQSGKWTVESELVNALAKTGMTSPFAWFGGDGTTDDFDVCSHGLLFLARDPTISPIRDTRMDCYYVPLHVEQGSRQPPSPIVVEGLKGVAWSPLFSPDGKKAVFHQTRYEEMDKHRVVLVPDIKNSLAAVELFATEDGKGLWDVSGTSNVGWSNDSSTIYLTAEYQGVSSLWSIDVATEQIELPSIIYDSSSVSAASPLSKDSTKLLVSSSSFTDNSIYTVVDPLKSITRVISANLDGLGEHGISHEDQISSFWFPGAQFKIHAYMIKPSTFSSTQRYPLAYVFHGGPEQAWLDAWSTRWNLLCLAEQGYIVVAVNFTGSTGYGDRICESVRGQWADAPFRDLELGFEYIKQNFGFVDTSRAVGLGGSYGGYMTAWIQGQPFARSFKALVCHNGQIANQSELYADDLTGSVSSWKGTYWENRQLCDKYDPARFTENWATPMLIIHGMKDFRVPVEQGLGMFTVLQYKSIDSKFLTFPDENHWVLKPENSLVWHKEVYDWINNFSAVPKGGDV